MALKLMYITKDPKVARIAETAGTDRIFVDMEYIGKYDRQGGMNTVQSRHTVEDVRIIRDSLNSSELLVRINPMHEEGSYLGIAHTSSAEEIKAVIEAGADILMLPYYKTVEEVKHFLDLVDGRARTMVLLETAEAGRHLEETLELHGLDMVHIGLNDLSLDRGKRFMFQSLADGTVDELCKPLRTWGKPYGFGGIAAPGGGMLPAEYIIREHYRLGSTCTILARSFCDSAQYEDMDALRECFEKGICAVRAAEEECLGFSAEQFDKNHQEVQRRVDQIVEYLRNRS